MPFPFPGDFPDPGIEPGSPALQADSLPTELRGEPNHLLRPLITYPNLLSLLQQITPSCVISSSVSLQGTLKSIPSFPTHQARGHIPEEDWPIDFTHEN